MKKLILFFILILFNNAEAIKLSSGCSFPANSSTEIRIFDTTSLALSQDWTNTGVSERASGLTGYSCYYYDFSAVELSHGYQIDWRDSGTPTVVANEIFYEGDILDVSASGRIVTELASDQRVKLDATQPDYVPALEATSQSIKNQTDQLVFVAGKVDATASVSLSAGDISDISTAVVSGIDLGTVWDVLLTSHTTSGSAGKKLSDIPLTIADTGTGDTEVTVNSGGVDNLRYIYGTTAVDNARVLAYLKSDYDAGNLGASYIKGSTTTTTDGRWSNHLHLDKGFTYTIEFYKQGQFGPDTKEIIISSDGTIQ